jgi:MFS family permease
MSPERRRFLFLNLGHAYTHLFLLIHPTAILVIERDLGRDYGDLLLPSTAAFAAFGLGTLPAGWLGDRLSRPAMLVAMFVGLGAAALLTGLAQETWHLTVGLALIGLFASIYHPVGIAMVAETGAALGGRLGRALGINGVYGNLGVAAAPLLTGLLAGSLGWRWAFVVPGALALVTGLCFLPLLRQGPAPARGTQATAGAPPRDGRFGVVLFLVIGGLFGGLAFHTMTIAVPKVLQEALPGATPSVAAAGGLASLIFACAAFAQIAVGGMIDRYPIRRVALAVAGAQVPLFLLLGWLSGPGAVALLLFLMLFVFGEIPISDALVARYATAAWRARLYALKYVLSLGVSVAAVPSVAWLHRPGAGFGGLFALLAACMVAVVLAAAFLPGRGAARARSAGVRTG